MEHKYVRFEDYGFVIWPMSHSISHADMGRRFSVEGRPISAGFVSFAKGVVCCYGRSESLNMDRLPDDEQVLKRQLGI